MADEGDKTPCKYGINCYRRNEEHRERFSHPSKDQPSGQDESKATDHQRAKSPLKPADLPLAKRRKTVSSHGSDDSGSDSDNDVDDQPEIESTSNGSAKEDDASEVKKSPNKAQNDEAAAAPARCSEFINENFDKGPHNQRVEHQQLLGAPASFIRSKFLVEMPTDFYEFWSFCEANTKGDSKPENLFSKFGLSLVGPFDVLAKKFHNIAPFEPGEYLRHWRFYYDPPEFQVSKQCCAIVSKHKYSFIIERICLILFYSEDHYGER